MKRCCRHILTLSRPQGQMCDAISFLQSATRPALALDRPLLNISYQLSIAWSICIPSERPLARLSLQERTLKVLLEPGRGCDSLKKGNSNVTIAAPPLPTNIRIYCLWYIYIGLCSIVCFSPHPEASLPASGSAFSESSSPSTDTLLPCTAFSTSVTKLSMYSRSLPTRVTVLRSFPHRG